MSHANNQILYFSDKATVLARSYEDQIRDLLMLGDYLTEDIANDWTLNDIKTLEELVKEKLFSPKAIDLYIQIDSNFASVSNKGELFDSNIWTLEGLRTHPFWKMQRELAQEFLNQIIA